MNNLINKMSTCSVTVKDTIRAPTKVNKNATDTLTSQLSGLSLEKSEYVLDQSLVVRDAVHVTKIRLNFYQLWSMFGTLPVVYEKGKSGYLSEGTRFYEYKIQGPTALFTVYAWNMKGTFLQENQWYIGSTAQDSNDTKAFLEYLYEALECYSLYYKGIERHIFESEHPEVDCHLKLIKRELIEHRELLKTL
ncbi:MAG: hypothetical protein EBU90_08055 [Proteobacteria bacterium]|nr:hypothetical protein [Pseudomonadota bacterium]NBP15274.1 hypothetical protein [bacterium]